MNMTAKLYIKENFTEMLMHADYFSAMKSRIRVFTNRIEFENPGAFPRPVDELLRQDVSIPRNPVLAKLFRCAKLCENAGYGFDKMLLWKKETTFEVAFEHFVDMSRVVFMLESEAGTEDRQIGGQIELTKQQQIVLNLIRQDGRITRQELREKMGINSSAVQKHLKALMKKGYIRREGKTRAGYWVIVK